MQRNQRACAALTFWVNYARLPSTALHYSGFDSSAGVNGAHAIVCSFSRAPRTWRHSRVRDAFAFAAWKFDLQVHTNGRRDAPTYEFPFQTDDHGAPTSKRSDLHITDERGQSYILDVTICDPTNALCVKHRAQGQTGSRSHDDRSSGGRMPNEVSRGI
jgi:hypothetical protein